VEFQEEVLLVVEEPRLEELVLLKAPNPQSL
jgi:hypothetical protein